MSDTPVADMTFEQAMAELEQVVGRLERGDVALDESITLYERGAALKKRCDSKLKEAEEKVAAIGRRFRETVLALGGSRHPMTVFKAFRGREPSTQALLRHRGLVTAA